MRMLCVRQFWPLLRTIIPDFQNLDYTVVACQRQANVVFFSQAIARHGNAYNWV